MRRRHQPKCVTYDVRVAAVPRISPDQAEEIARTYYGVDAAATRLAAEHDDTFRLVTADGTDRLLKISVTDRDARTGPANGAAAEPVSFQTAVLLHLALAAPELPVQRVVAAADGRPELTLGSGPRRLVRMTAWLDGQLLSGARTGVGLRRSIGGTLARLSRALRGFDHPGAHRTHRWDLQNCWRLRELLGELPELEGGLRAELTACLDRFETVVRPRLAGRATQVIHTDFHGENLLTDGERITGILDFGDALTGPVAMDVGVAACYQLGGAGHGSDLLAPALDVVAGYHEVDPLDDKDLELVAEFIVARVVARIVVSQWNAAREPENTGYLLRRTPQAIEHFAALRAVPHDEIVRRLRAACPLEACP
jgi:hydroxylysine kinase